jgi:spoIIIJ-associated protein
MEWVETTGKTTEEASARALDLLGVDHDDAEIVILSEPSRGLFGRVKGQARVRARVRPIRPRPKVDRRDRRRRERNQSPESGDRTIGDSGDRPSGAPADGSAESPKRQKGPRRNGGGGASDAAGSPERPARTPRSEQARPPKGEPASNNDHHDDDEQESYDMDPELMQAEAGRAVAFLEGLATAFGSAGTATATITEDTIDVALTGTDLGLLVGPRGATLQSIQELTRAATQRGGRAAARMHIDVASYRLKRNEALTRFALQLATEVVSTGTPRVLEPMGAADRKVIHDAVQTVAGVESISEGEDPHRHVLIRPAG